MATTAPTAEQLLEEFLRDLQKRDVALDDKARAAVEGEFRRRLGRSADRDHTLLIWDQNRGRYVDLLDDIAARKRAAGPAGVSPVVLEEQDVRASFAVCSRLCPGPA
jgi:hypothetical protein